MGKKYSKMGQFGQKHIDFGPFWLLYSLRAYMRYDIIVKAKKFWKFKKRRQTYEQKDN